MTGSSLISRYLAASLVFGGLCFGGVAIADDVVVPPDPNDRPAFLLVSVAPTFNVQNLSDLGLSDEELRAQAGTLGAKVVRVTLGNYVAGDGIRTTRFAGLGPIEIDLSDVPPDPETELPPNFDGHQFTILGSFRTLDPDATIHMTTPFPGAIAPEVQEAFFNASAFFDDPGALPKYPSTVQMAFFVYDHQGEHESGAVAEVQDILEAMFVAEPPPELVLAGASPSEGAGTIFPHNPGEDGLFEFHAQFDETVIVDICLPVLVDVKPGNAANTVNSNLEGVLWIAVLTTDDFDAVEELDPSTFEGVSLDDNGSVVTSVPAIDWEVRDVDHDGDLDIRFKFSVPDLAEGDTPPLTTDSDTVHFRGDTQNGMCVEGFDTVRFVPPQH